MQRRKVFLRVNRAIYKSFASLRLGDLALIVLFSPESMRKTSRQLMITDPFFFGKLET